METLVVLKILVGFRLTAVFQIYSLAKSQPKYTSVSSLKPMEFDFATRFRTTERNNENNITSWSMFSCCRSGLNLRTRERRINGELLIELMSCQSGYCKDCSDDVELCETVLKYRKSCDNTDRLKNFMIRHCPSTCGWCRSTTAMANKRIQSKKNAVLVMVKVNINACFMTPDYVYDYKFSTSPDDSDYPWISISYSLHFGEVDHFYLYNGSHGQFTDRIYFCTYVTDQCREVWIVSILPCYLKPHQDWKTGMILYGSLKRVSNSEKLSVANRIGYPGNSRIFRYMFCCGYRWNKWQFYAPKSPKFNTEDVNYRTNTHNP